MSFAFILSKQKLIGSPQRATLDALGGEYEVEVGHGDTRDSYLRDNGVDTYFIVPPAHRRKVILMKSTNSTLIFLFNFL